MQRSATSRHNPSTPCSLMTHKKALTKLTHHLSDSLDEVSDVKFPFETPSHLSAPNIFHIATLTQAALNGRTVEIDYVSLGSGTSTRVIMPHSIVDNGLRWHVRAFDTRSNEFRDFVITRITNAIFSDLRIEEHQTKMADNQWLRIVPLELVPHPNNIKHTQAIELDYGMKDAVLNLDVRAAVAGYLLRIWNVDCSADASQSSPEHQLWLRNTQTLYGVSNLHLASGYQKENSNHG